MNTYKGKTAEQWRAMAAASLAERNASFERCDTDGFLSQWASGVMASRYELCAQLAESNGMHEFLVAVDDQGRILETKTVKTKYGYCFMLNEPDAAKFGRKFIPCNPGRVWKSIGLREGKALLPAMVYETTTGGCIIRDERSKS